MMALRVARLNGRQGFLSIELSSSEAARFDAGEMVSISDVSITKNPVRATDDPGRLEALSYIMEVVLRVDNLIRRDMLDTKGGK